MAESKTESTRFLALRSCIDGIVATMTLVIVDSSANPKRLLDYMPFTRETHSTRIVKYIESEQQNITVFEL